MGLKKFVENTILEYINENNNYFSKQFPKINLKTEDVFNMIDYHGSYKNLYPNYDEDNNEYEDDHYFSSKEEAYEDINSTLEFFDSLPNPLTIYRTIKVKSLDYIDYDNLGESWSYEKQSAIDFANNQARGNVLIIAQTNSDNVDWPSTIELYYQFSRSYDGYDENEIRIIDSDKLFNIQTERI